MDAMLVLPARIMSLRSKYTKSFCLLQKTLNKRRLILNSESAAFLQLYSKFRGLQLLSGYHSLFTSILRGTVHLWV